MCALAALVPFLLLTRHLAYAGEIGFLLHLPGLFLAQVAALTLLARMFLLLLVDLVDNSSRLVLRAMISLSMSIFASFHAASVSFDTKLIFAISASASSIASVNS